MRDPTLEDVEILYDLGLLEEEEAEPNVNLPLPEPSVPHLYVDLWQPDMGYSITPVDVVTIAIERKDYPEASEALNRLEYLREQRGLGRADDQLYWTMQHWFIWCVSKG